MTGVERRHWPVGSLATKQDAVALTPARAGWSYTGLRVVRLAPGGHIDLATGGQEMAVLPLTGGLEVRVDGRVLLLEGRDSVFTRVIRQAAGFAMATPSFDALRIIHSSRRRFSA